MIANRGCITVFKIVIPVALIAIIVSSSFTIAWANSATSVRAPMVDHFNLVQNELGKLAPSEWYSYESALYSELLEQQKCDVLIIPAQVQAYAIDKVGRDLITFAITDYIEKASGKCVYDPVMVEKVLGENLRSYERGAIFELANKLKVKKLIWVYAGHKKNLQLDLTLVVQKAKFPDQYTLNLPAQIKSWDGLVFSDEHPPYESVLPMLPEIARFCEFSKITKKSNQSVAYFTEVDVLPYIPDLLSENLGDAVDRAYLYQFLGALFPDNMVRSRERMYAKSLVVLNEISTDHPDYRLLKARAYFHLFRRPAALETLKGRLRGAEEKALYALLMGDYQMLKQQSEEIKHTLKRVLAKIELYDLHWHYELGNLDEKELEKLNFLVGDWNKLLYERYQRGNPWYVKSNLLLKQTLEKIFPSGFALKSEDLVNEKIALVQSIDRSTDLELSVYNHVQQLLKNESKQFCCADSIVKPGKMDYLQLFSELADDNIFRSFNYFSTIQGNAEKAQKVLDRFKFTYDGHPEFYYQLAKIYSVLSQRAEGASKTRWQNAAKEYAKNVFYREQGQGKIANEIKLMFMDKNAHAKYSFYDNDFPKRHYWKTDSLNIDRMLPENRSQAYIEKAKLDVKYSSNDLETLMELEQILFAMNASRQAIDAAIEKEQNRFVGHAQRAPYFAQRYFARDQSGQAIKIYQNTISAVPESWNAYQGLAQVYIQEGDMAKASETYLSFPYFDDHYGKSINRVTLANNAAQAGMSLQYIGAYQDATPLLVKAKNYDTGSALNLQSNYLLALYNKDYLLSAKTALKLANRYNDFHAYDAYLSFLHLFSHHDLAWSLHKSLLHKSQFRAEWSSLLVGMRIKQMSVEAVIAWLENQYSQTENQESYMRLLVGLQTEDRIPDEKFMSTISRLKLESPYFVHSDGKVYSQLPGQNRAILSGPDYFNRFNFMKYDTNTNPESEKLLFLQAYVYLLNGEYDQARRAFVKRAKYYSNDQYLQQYALPYFVWAHIKTGRSSEMYEYLQQQTVKNSPFLDFSIALMHGVTGNTSDALSSIESAIHKTTDKTYSQLNIWYQYLELTRWLYEQTEEEKYRDKIVWLAKHVQNLMPYASWAYATEAVYTSDRRNLSQILGIALYLDGKSELLRKFSTREKQLATRDFEKNNPFVFNESDLKDLKI